MRVAISGKMASGKSTAAEALVGVGFERMALADPLKRVANTIADWLRDRELIEGNVYSDLTNKASKHGREWLQFLGTECMRDLVLPDLWERVLVHRLPRGEDVVVDDLRFKTEAQALMDAEFLLIRIEAPDDLRLARAGWLYSGQETAGHRSEQELDDWDLWHKTFVNDKSRDEFQREVIAWARTMG